MNIEGMSHYRRDYQRREIEVSFYRSSGHCQRSITWRRTIFNLEFQQVLSSNARRRVLDIFRESQRLDIRWSLLPWFLVSAF